MQFFKDLLSKKAERKTLTPPDKVEELVWNVIAENHGVGIGYVNVFNYNWPFRAMIYEAYKKYKNDYEQFADEVYSSLTHEYWARSEYEVIVSSWPSGINEEEVERLVKEVESQKAKYPDAIHQRVYPDLENAVKIDVWDQVSMNWDNFIKYLWDNKKLISKFKEEYIAYYKR